MELVRFEEYRWGSPAYENRGPAHLERLTLRTIPEDASRAAELETGGIDVDVDVAPQHIAPGGEGREDHLDPAPVLQPPRLQPGEGRLQGRPGPQGDPHAVNREQIVQFVMRGQADVSVGFLHPLAPGATPKEEMRGVLPEFSLEKARALLGEAGWAPGPGGVRQKDVKPLRVTCYVFTELHERIVTPIQATLRDVGVDVQIRRLEAAAFTAATRAGDHDLRFLPMIYSSADFPNFFVSAAIPSPNTVRWRDDRTDSLFRVTQTTLKEAERVKAFQQLEQRLVGEAVVVPIQHIRWIFGMEGGRILHVGPRFEGAVDETVDARDRVLTPGLISTHAHIGGSPLDRSVIEDRGNPHHFGDALAGLGRYVASRRLARYGRPRPAPAPRPGRDRTGRAPACRGS